MISSVDVLAFAPHPDDAELYCSGTLLLLKNSGYRTGIVDLSKGELSTHGTARSREKETANASRILKLDVRKNLCIPDSNIANTWDNRLLVITALREYRPSTIFLPYPVDRHPDHVNASTLVKEAFFQSGLSKIETSIDGVTQVAYRPGKAFFYMLTHDFSPTITIDVSDTFNEKLRAIRCYKTQFFTGTESKGARTYINSPDFMEALLARSRRLGFLAGVKYGEGFNPLQPFTTNVESLL